MIKLIKTDKIFPHPDNPRKELGDLTELAESIKTCGILQNLTVVPGIRTENHEDKGTYVCIIGHRRLEASKLAGLTEVPCVISDMALQEQVATMLLENMQRSDLTVYEQAQGFQMMLDLGETVDDISHKTGFSDSTVRRRVKLLDLDQEKFRESVERGATLQDYAELDKIQSPELKNKVLEKIGTPNFKWELQRAIDKEKTEKWLAGLIEQLSTFATELKGTYQGKLYITTYYVSRNDEAEKPEDAGEAKYYYDVSNYGYVALYRDPMQTEQTEEDAEAKEQRERWNAQSTALGEISRRAYRLRREFVCSLSDAKAKKNIGTIIEFSIYSLLDSYISLEYEEYADLLNIPASDDEDKEWEFGDGVEGLRRQPERYMLIAIYCLLDSSVMNYYNWDCSHRDNADLNRVYDFLGRLGYQMSDEEKALRDGTHELFKRNDNE